MLATKEVFLTSPKWDFWNNQVSANPYKLPPETALFSDFLTPKLDFGQQLSERG